MNEKINGITETVEATLDNGTGEYDRVRLSIGDNLSHREQYYISLSPPAARCLAADLIRASYQAEGYDVDGVDIIGMFGECPF